MRTADWESFEVAEVPGGAIAYYEWGDGEPLILHHGAESHKGQYGIFVPHLAAGIRAISYDQRDVEDTVNPQEPYTIEDLADDCIALMDALGLAKAHVMGISLGGAIALNVALRHPERTHSLIVGAAPDSFTARPNEFLARLQTLPPEEKPAYMLGAGLSPTGQQDEQLMATMASLTRKAVAYPGSRRQAAVASHDVRGRLGEIVVPTLLVYGEDDPLIPVAWGREVHEQIPGSELVVIPGARHGLSFEFRERTAQLVNDWVTRNPMP